MVRYVKYLVFVFLMSGMAMHDMYAMKKTSVVTTIRVATENKHVVANGTELKLPSIQDVGKEVYKLVQQLSTQSTPDKSSFLLLLNATKKGDLAAVNAILNAVHTAIENKDSRKRAIQVFAQFLRARSEDKKTVLHHAAIHGNPEMARTLIQAYKKFAKCEYAHKDKAFRAQQCENFVNACDNQQRTPLHYAAEGAHLDVVKVLAQYKADVNARDKSASTPLNVIIAAVVDKESVLADNAVKATIEYFIIILGVKADKDMVCGEPVFDYYNGYITSSHVRFCKEIVENALEQREKALKAKAEKAKV